MLKLRFCVFAACAALACALFPSSPASADGIENVYEQSLLPAANDAIKATMEEQRKQEEAKRRQALAPAPSKVSNGTVAQIPPVSQQRISPVIGLPTGIGYTAAVTTAYPYGNIGNLGKQGWLMGGTDLSLSYAPVPTSRFVVSMFQLQHWPYGFNSGLAPIYVAGFLNPAT